MNGLMQGKRGLIMGLANDRSLAWGIARALEVPGAIALRISSAYGIWASAIVISWRLRNP